MEKVTIYLKPELKKFYEDYAEYKELSFSALVRYALKRLVAISPVKGIEPPQSDSDGTNDDNEHKTPSEGARACQDVNK